MSISTQWVLANDDVARMLLSGDVDAPTTWLDAICEIDLIALAQVLEVPYEPELVLESPEGVVMRLPARFLLKLASLEPHTFDALATQWQVHAEELNELETHEIIEILESMNAFARSANEGAGALSVVTF